MNKLRRLVVPWPQARAEENRTWFKLFQKCQNVPKILDSHRCWLLTRDLAAVSFLFFTFGTAGMWIARGNPEWPVTYAFLMFLTYLVMVIAARNYANRFVCNVLTEYIAGER